MIADGSNNEKLNVGHDETHKKSSYEHVLDETIGLFSMYSIVNVLTIVPPIVDVH